jgi:diguanylate cyclase (GGDEF)-like protein/PAS domain S-box-containing protein
VSFLDISSTKTGIPFEAIVANANDVILVTDAKTIDGIGPRIVYVNQAFCDLTGYAKQEVIGKTPRILQRETTNIETKKRIREALVNKLPISEKILNYSKTDIPYWLDMNIFPLENMSGEVTYFAAVERNITSQVEKEAMLQEMATRDLLTGLLNRRGFFDLARRQLGSQVDKNESLIALIDIDYFKNINDSFGHDCGDKALVYLANLLRLMFRESDLLCRFGGEEFAIFLIGADITVGKRKLEAFRQKMANSTIDIGDGNSIAITVSIGIAQLHCSSMSIEDVIIKADKALYEAKNTGRNGTVVYQK